jgi:hypothetical protein
MYPIPVPNAPLQESALPARIYRLMSRWAIRLLFVLAVGGVIGSAIWNNIATNRLIEQATGENRAQQVAALAHAGATGRLFRPAPVAQDACTPARGGRCGGDEQRRRGEDCARDVARPRPARARPISGVAQETGRGEPFRRRRGAQKRRREGAQRHGAGDDRARRGVYPARAEGVRGFRRARAPPPKCWRTSVRKVCLDCWNCSAQKRTRGCAWMLSPRWGASAIAAPQKPSCRS